MPLPNMTNYLFWHNRQDCCFSLSSIFISSSLLSDQCWWQYIKCLDFQWNEIEITKACRGLQMFSGYRATLGACSSLSHTPCSPDFPVVIRAGSVLPGYHPGYLVFVIVTQWVALYFVVTWKGQQQLWVDNKTTHTHIYTAIIYEVFPCYSWLYLIHTIYIKNPCLY